jgi:GT2 family glycosyltransferase
MQKIAIGIPTFKRITKLERCLRSIEAQSFLYDMSIFIYCDNNDKETYDYLNNKYKEGLPSHQRRSFIPLKIVLNDKREFVVGSWNKFFNMIMTTDNQYTSCLLLVDDVELNNDCIEKAVNYLEKFYPDTDGIIGINQKNPEKLNYTFAKFGQILIGRKFIERYKEVNYQVWTPFYKHFYSDYECFMYASSLKKFYFAEDALLKHYHPGFYPEEIDKTHNVIRRPSGPKDHDIEIFKDRQKRKVNWGNTWIA